MEFPRNFICASEDICYFDHHVAAPYLRKSFPAKKGVKKAELLICGVGMYELFINGVNITKGPLAPYLNNPDDMLYYDCYDVAQYLQDGENVIGVVLGNGILNNFGAKSWWFDDASYRTSPRLALRLDLVGQDGETAILADESFKTAPSPILFDDLHCGEYYDARREIAGWNLPGFDDSAWENAKKTSRPRGECKICTAEPITVSQEIKPVSVTEQDGGFLYDFGINCSGICRLHIDAKEGQEITLRHGEILIDGKLNTENFEHIPQEFVQKDIYTCKEGPQTHVPSFTFHGFQYVYVQGITKEQATKDLLTYLVMHSDLEARGDFSCSDEIVNTLQKLTRRSTLANFYYIVMDCPHREKNGWTADAAISTEQMLLNLAPEKSLREWLCNIRKAMRDDGAVPAIIPTGGWGFEWGSGPAWDWALVIIPYLIYKYRGDQEVLKENATAIFKYLNFLSTQFNEDGLFAWGLGDWVPTGRFAMDYICPLEVSDTIMAMDLCDKAARIYEVLNMPLQQQFAQGLYEKIRANARKKLIDFSTMTVYGNCQPAQSLGIYYNLFEEGEKPKAFEKLLELIRTEDDFMYTGVLGARVMFTLLSDRGYVDLALKMITRPEFPSYGNWLERGATALWEEFQPKGGAITSRCHHFWGFISGWFIRSIAGIQLNPDDDNVNEILIAPQFPSSMTHAEGYHIAPTGRIDAGWKREGEDIVLNVTLPEGMRGRIVLPDEYMFEDKVFVKPAQSGTYRLKNRQYKK